MIVRIFTRYLPCYGVDITHCLHWPVLLFYNGHLIVVRQINQGLARQFGLHNTANISILPFHGGDRGSIPRSGES
ncbi:hypothetical protein WAI453_007953 [Rhynchosporium graminicola]